MAHFAELDKDNVVLRVVVVGNADTSDANGVEKEQIGAAFCESLFGGTWKQTSYNRNIRKNYAGIGYKYDESVDAFIPPKPFPSWILNNDARWDPPAPYPTDGLIYKWDEATLSWISVTNSKVSTSTKAPAKKK